MRVEFDKNGFSADMEDCDRLPCQRDESLLYLFKSEKSLSLGLLSLLAALFSLPFGLYIGISLNLVKSVAESKLSSWSVALLVISIAIAVISLSLATASIVFFKKEKTARGKYGLSAAIAAIAIAIFCLVLNFINIL